MANIGGVKVIRPVHNTQNRSEGLTLCVMYPSNRTRTEVKVITTGPNTYYSITSRSDNTSMCPPGGVLAGYQVIILKS